jgi:uncharacterized damage-inducible protein DinB
MARPAATDFPAYFAGYISKVNTDSIAEAINTYSAPLHQFYTSLPEAKADFAYAEGKWTVKEMLQHIIDAERVFSYRVMCIARKDKTSLPSFDENLPTQKIHKPIKEALADLKEEFIAVRKSTDLLLQSLTEDQFGEMGTSSNKPVTAKAIAYIIFGHMLHHKGILEERYL